MEELSELELYQLDAESLKNLFLRLRSIINQKKKNLEETKNLEIYFCYVTKILESKI